MKFTAHEAEILLHRLDGGTIPEVMADSDIMSEEEAEDACAKACAALRSPTRDVDLSDEHIRKVLEDAADGSTFFAGQDEAVANGQLSDQLAAAYRRAARGIERKLDVEVPDC